MAEENKLSPVEEIKLQSRYLRGSIAEELADGSDHFGESSVQLLKVHGTYQQDDRDRREAARREGAGKAYMFMVRSRIPGGRLTSAQLLAELDLCDAIGNTTLRITSRQGLQLHGVLKGHLRQAIRRINELQLTTLGACGDVNRNVMCCPAPYQQPIYAQTQALAEQLARHFAPRTPAYPELWLRDPDTGEEQRVGGAGDDETVEPLYGRCYLPRKFKIGIAFPFDNCSDVYANDLGLLAIVRDGRIGGYNLLVGGGMGCTPSVRKTFPALSQPLAFVPPEEVVGVATAVLRVQRDFGNREDRKTARLKYLLKNWGVPQFRAKVEEYYGRRLEDPEPVAITGCDEHLGWAEQGDGRLFYGLNVENGRIRDDDSCQLKLALREICGRFAPGIRLTGQQSLLFTDLDPAAKPEVDALLRRLNVKRSEDYSPVRRWSMACVALPTCGMAVTDSERALPGVLDALEAELQKLDLPRELFSLRMTGCSNGCVRPYNSDVGLVGRGKGKYAIHLGGRLFGDRLNFLHQDHVPIEEIVPTLGKLLAFFKQARRAGETFGDFCQRQGNPVLLAQVGRGADSDAAQGTAD